MNAEPQYTPDQRRALRRERRQGTIPDCPVCATRMTLRDVPRPEGVSYERQREWLLCPGCRRSIVLDRDRPDRRRRGDVE